MALQPVPRLFDVFRCLIVRENVPEIILRQPALSRNAVFKLVNDGAPIREIQAKNKLFVPRHECEHFPQVSLAQPCLLNHREELPGSPKNRRTLRPNLSAPAEA